MFNKKNKEERVHLFAIYDKVAEEFGPLYQAKNELVAQRSYIDFMKDIKFVDDYTLFHIGEINKEYHLYPDKFEIDTQNSISAIKKYQESIISKNLPKEVDVNDK